MSEPVLVVGGGPAGLSAGYALATMGQRVVLVDKVDRLGGAPISVGLRQTCAVGRMGEGRHRRHG